MSCFFSFKFSIIHHDLDTSELSLFYFRLNLMQNLFCLDSWWHRSNGKQRSKQKTLIVVRALFVCVCVSVCVCDQNWDALIQWLAIKLRSHQKVNALFDVWSVSMSFCWSLFRWLNLNTMMKIRWSCSMAKIMLK